jgi:beta-glucuronidase
MDLIVLDPAGRTIAAASASDPGSTAENRVERHEFAVELPDARPYDPADPALYLVGITLGRSEAKHRVALKVGLREVGVEEGGLYFNGERIVLRGVGLVEDDPVTGATRSETLVRRDLGLVRELNANFVRLAHHPHSGGTLRRARDLGLLFSQEIPFHRVGSGLLTGQEDLSLSRFGLHQLANRELLARAQQQLFEMVERDANNPALILWGVGSESFDLGDAAGRVHGWLADSVRFLDATRPVTMAELTTSVEYLDRLRTGAEFMDVVSVNLADGADDAKLDSLERQFPGKPILVAELGAGTPPLSARERAEHLHASLDRLRARDRIAGTVVWVLADFLCPGCPDPDDVGGIVSRDRTPKEAYRLLQREYGGSERAERDAAEKGS